MGLLKEADQARFDRLRYVEVKHGRIAMLGKLFVCHVYFFILISNIFLSVAVLGHIVTAKGDRLPGEIAYGVPFSSIKSGLQAFADIPAAGILQLVLFIGLMELGFSTVQEDIEARCKKEMTNRGWSEATQRRKAAVELNNGRAAQMGILALMVHEKLDNNPYIINSLLGAPVPFNQ